MTGIDAVRVGKATVGTRRQYAEQSKAWKHGDRSEDQLLQRIWNLSDDVFSLIEYAAGLASELAAAKHFMECADTPLMRDVMAERDKAQVEREEAQAMLRDALDTLRKVADNIDPKLGAIAPMNALHDARATLACWTDENGVWRSGPSAPRFAPVNRLIEQMGSEPFLVPDVTPATFRKTEVFHYLRDLCDAGVLTKTNLGYVRGSRFWFQGAE